MTELQREQTARAVKAAVFIGIVEADRLDWQDVRDDLYRVHAVVSTRLHAADRAVWHRRLEIEGPNQPDEDRDHG